MRSYRLATIDTPLGKADVFVRLHGQRDATGDIGADDIAGLWSSVRRASRRLDPRFVAKRVARYAYERGVAQPVMLTRRAMRIARLAAEGDPRAIALAVQTAKDAARGAPGADIAYKAVRALHEAYRSRPVQATLEYAQYVPGAQALSLPARMLGQGAGVAHGAMSAVMR